MESRNELKEIGIKNRTYYYFGDIKRIREFEILVLGIVNRDIYIYIYIYIIYIYNIPYKSYKAFMGPKPLCIRFDEIDRFIKIYDGIMM